MWGISYSNLMMLFAMIPDMDSDTQNEGDVLEDLIKQGRVK